jgi:endonuclease G
MTAPAQVFAFDFDQLLQAAENWEQRTKERDRTLALVDQRRYSEAESPERLARRVNHLNKHMKLSGKSAALLSSPGTFSSEVEEVLASEFVQPEKIDDLLYERVLGQTRDFLFIDFLERAVRAAECIGRIVTRLEGGRSAFATGFLVGPGLLLTNHHVLKNASAAAVSVVEMDYQRDREGLPMTVQQFSLDPERFFLNNRELDFALVGVSPRSVLGRQLTDYGWCPLIGELGKINRGEAINIVQHPRGELKQLVIRENRLLDLLENFAHYEADTEPGSSGSPVFNDQWELVALHHCGVPRRDEHQRLLDIDGRPWIKGRDDPARLDWVANEGIRVSRIVAACRDARSRVRDRERPLLETILAEEPPPPRPPESGRSIGQNGRAKSDAGVVELDSTGNFPGLKDEMRTMSEKNSTIGSPPGSVTITIPLTITVSLGQPWGPAIVAPARETGSQPSIETPEEKIEPDPSDPGYERRPGYDPNFLGIHVPLPKLANNARSQAFALPGVNGNARFELKYHNFSVIFNKHRKLAFVSAVNLDADAMRFKREGRDQWFFDPRVPRELQAGDDLYSDNDLDRGHLTRRDDAAWGPDLAAAKLANDDTFHFTNCSPQHKVFNQSSEASKRGLRLWGNLENHITSQARKNKKRLCIFNGPIFRDTDQSHRGVQVPREFWKLVVFEKDDGSPSAIAFKLSQDELIAGLPAEEFTPGPFTVNQIKIRALELLTRLRFDPITQLDPLERLGAEEAFAPGTEVVRLDSLEDIVL